LDEEKKQGSFWSFVGVAVLCSIAVFVVELALEVMICVYFLKTLPLSALIAQNPDKSQYVAIQWSISFCTQLLAVWLSTFIYSKRRTITQELAKGVALVYIIVASFFSLFSIAMELIAKQFVFSLPMDIVITIAWQVVVCWFLKSILLKYSTEENE
jgi:hypothetical protein